MNSVAVIVIYGLAAVAAICLSVGYAIWLKRHTDMPKEPNMRNCGEPISSGVKYIKVICN